MIQNDQILKDILKSLQANTSITVGQMISEPQYSQHAHQGLYEIRDPSNTRTVYIGKTITAREGVAQRIWDHAKNISGLLNSLGVTPEKFKDYHVRTLSVPDSRLRGLAEYYGIAVIDPRGNLVG